MGIARLVASGHQAELCARLRQCPADDTKTRTCSLTSFCCSGRGVRVCYIIGQSIGCSCVLLLYMLVINISQSVRFTLNAAPQCSFVGLV